jgi:hypothetical protein
MVQHSIVKSKRSDAETSTGRGGLNQSILESKILESKFKTELKPVFRKGFSTVYRMRIPDEIAEREDVQKTKCIRLKLLKPSLEGRALPQEDFAVKMSGKNILVPMAIIVSKGLEKLKNPTTVTFEFLGPASRAERMPMPQSSTKELAPRSDAKKESRIEGTRDIRVNMRKAAPTPIKVGEESAQDASPPETIEDISQLKSEVESMRNELRELNEKLKERVITTKPTEPPKPVEATPAKEVIEPEFSSPPKSSEAPTQVHGVTQAAPDKQTPPPVPSVEGAIPVEFPKPPIVTPPLPADSQERLVSINDKPAKYEVVRVDDESTKPTTSPPGEVKSTVTPSPKPEEKKIRFEKDGEYVSIYLGDEQISTVSIMKTVSGPVFSCGTCDWEAIKKGREPSTASCEHIEMVKKFLSNSNIRFQMD